MVHPESAAIMSRVRLEGFKTCSTRMSFSMPSLFASNQKLQQKAESEHYISSWRV